VNIHPGEGDQIAVTAVKKLGSGNGKDTLIEMKQEEDGRVIVMTVFPTDRLTHIFSHPKPCEVDYDVRVPHACVLNISGVSNSAVIRGITGDIELKTVSGSLTIEESGGKIGSRR
jgi:hypothetical protein